MGCAFDRHQFGVGRGLFLSLICVCVSLGSSLGAAPPVVLPPFMDIPAGYADGRTDLSAEELQGTYGSVYSDESLQSLQRRIANLEKRIMGAQGFPFEEKPVRVAEVLFLLEGAVLKLELAIANLPETAGTEFERASLQYATTRLYESVRKLSERQFEDMVRRIDVKFPGPNGKQFRQDLGTDAFYLPNFRSSVELSPEEIQKRYLEKKESFEKAGGHLDEIKILDRNWLSTLGAYTRVEYVERENGEIAVTEGEAGHVLLANGGPVKAAGQMILLRARNGKFCFLAISNASGNFKPDLLSAQIEGMRIADILDLPPTQLAVTKGEPLSPQAVKIYGKIMEEDSDLTKARVQRLRKLEQRLKPKIGAGELELSCAKVFNRTK